MHRAHLERLRNQQRMLATDTPTTLLAVAMTHYELPGLGWMGGMSTWYRSMLPSAPTLPPHGHCSGHGASKVLSGTGIARTACRPYLDPGLRPGFFGSRFGLSLEKGAAWRLPARRDSSSTLSSLAIRASRSFNRLLRSAFSMFSLPSSPSSRSTRSPSSRTDCLQDLNMHCRIAGAAAFVQPLPSVSGKQIRLNL